MHDFLLTLAFSLQVTGQIFVPLALGVLLMRIDFLDDAFVEMGSRLVFSLGLPASLFLSVNKAGLGASANRALLSFGLIMTPLV